jgi:hypothetical protein
VFFDQARKWMNAKHRTLVDDFRDADIGEPEYVGINEFCSTLLAIVGVAARLGEEKAEEDLYDLYRYWQGRAMFATDFGRQWKRVGIAPLPLGLIATVGPNDLESQLLRDPVILVSCVHHRNSMGQWRGPAGARLEAMFRDALRQLTTDSSYSRLESDSTRWSFLMGGSFSSTYPTRLDVAEHYLTHEGIKRLANRYDDSEMDEFPEYRDAA